MDLYDILAWVIVFAGAGAGTFMAVRAWKYRRDPVLLLCLIIMACAKYTVGLLYLLLILGESHLQVPTLTIGTYIRPIMPVMLIMPCIFLEVKQI